MLGRLAVPGGRHTFEGKVAAETRVHEQRVALRQAPQRVGESAIIDPDDIKLERILLRCRGGDRVGPADQLRPPAGAGGG